LRSVAARCSVVAFPAGERIMRQGEQGSFALAILDGEVDVYVEIPAGLIHMATLGHDRIVGELGGFTDAPRTATVVARSDVSAPRRTSICTPICARRARSAAISSTFS